MLVHRAPSLPLFTSPSTVGRRAVLSALGLGAAGITLAACGGSDAASGKDLPVVIVGCYGLQYMAQQVAGDAAKVVNLAKPGMEPHDVELSVAETATVQKADVIVQIPGFQSALDDIVSAKKLEKNTIDVSEVVTLLPASGEHEHEDHEDEDHEDEHEHGRFDPHFWNDPTLLAKVASELGSRLAKVLPDQADTFTGNAKKAVTTLTDLDTELKKTYGAVDGKRVFVTSHTAFAYLARRYGLEQVGIAGIDPETEPSPRRLLALQRLIKKRKVSTVFFEESASPKVAETLAKNVGVQSESLDNLETQLDPKKDYPAVMREDAEKLVESWT